MTQPSMISGLILRYFVPIFAPQPRGCRRFRSDQWQLTAIISGVPRAKATERFMLRKNCVFHLLPRLGLNDPMSNLVRGTDRPTDRKPPSERS